MARIDHSQYGARGRAVCAPLKHPSLRGGSVGHKTLHGVPRFSRVAGVVLGWADRLPGRGQPGPPPRHPITSAALAMTRPVCSRSPMTSPLDSGACGGGHADTEQPAPASGQTQAAATGGSQPASNRLLVQVHDRDTAHRLARRLTGQGLPDVELRTLHAAQVPLRSHVQGWVAVEFFPGEGARPTSEGEQQMAFMRAHIEHADGFLELAAANTRMLSVISDSPTAIDLTSTFIDPRGLVLCDPELLIADALGLPTVEVTEVTRYRRLTLLAKDARIEKVILPPEENLDSHFRWVAIWIQAARG